MCSEVIKMSETRKIQNAEMKILKKIKDVCDNQGYIYYMIGGTLLGAVRHKGFIPWDDDVDIAMPREDYEKFLQYADLEFKGEYRICNFKTSKDYQYYISRVMDRSTKLIEIRINNESRHTYACVDIFPIDNFPNNILIRKLFCLKIFYHRALMSLCYTDSIDWSRKRSKFETIVLKTVSKIPIKKITTPQKQKLIIDRLLKTYSADNTMYVGTIMGAYRSREIVPREYFGNGIFYTFESERLRGPEMHDSYLTHIYGDYMKIPDEKDRKSHYVLYDDVKRV